MSLGFRGRLLGTLLVGVLAASAASGQTTWYVDATNCPGPGSGTPADPFCKIQDAINAAAPNAGPPDEIVVADGVYTGTGNKNLDFGGKIIRLHGAGGDPASCTIDCEGSGRGFYFHNGETTAAVVEGFTIRNGYVDSNSLGGEFGGGVYCSSSNPTLSNCAITGNEASGSTSRGGGVYCSASSPALVNCTVSANTAHYVGAGLAFTSSSNPVLTDCLICGNEVAYSGGGLSCTTSSNPVLTGCTIDGNTASGSTSWGGGLDCVSSNPTLTDCLISGNTASGGGGVYGSSSNATLTNCRITGNTASNTHGGGAYCSAGTVLTGCTITGNLTQSNGGGVYGSATLTGCTISGNTADSGGGAYCSSSAAVLINCVISGNTASHGGGVSTSSSGGNPTLTNCTISRNLASVGGGGAYLAGSTLTNCILWGDTPQEISVASGTPSVTYCDVQGGYTGTGNINLDPDFAFEGDFHLMAESPCIDAGTNSPTGGLPPTDVEGGFRPLDGNGDGVALADLGAYEVNPVTAAVALSMTRIEFGFPEGQGGSEPQALSIRNAGGGTLYWSLSWDASWLQADPVQGVSTNEVNVVTLTANTEALPHGTYAAALQVSDPAASNSPRLVEVVLNVTATLSVPGTYPTIQAAIDAAVPGDEVVVADGVYTGPGNKDLDFHGLPITVRSASHNPETCIIDCEHDGRGFYFHHNEPAATTVEGLTVRNGYVTESSPGSTSGGAVYCSFFSGPTLTKCVISGNACESGAGGGVYCSACSSPVMSDCTISENTAFSSGGGVYSGGSNLTLTNCTISRNRGRAGSGGGVCGNSKNLTLTNCTVRDNTAFNQAGGVELYSGNATLANCVITGNAASTGGGVYCSYYTPTLSNCTISGNRAFGSSTSYGGGVFCYGSSARFTNCTISGNGASSGGSVYCDSSATPALTNCILWGGSPQEIYVASGTPAVSYCDVQGGYTGTGNIDLDPRFAFDGDFHLTGDSPCIDAGTNTPAGGLPATDAEGIARPLDGNGDGLAVADMGAHEFNPSAPAIALDTTLIEFTFPEGQGNPEPRALSIRNAGGGTLNWSLSWEDAWLLVDPIQGSSTGEVDSVTLNIDPLAHGVYSAALWTTDPTASNSPCVVEVRVTVTAPLLVPQVYPTIQAAIDAAVPGDEVVVADGVYTGPGNKDLDLHGLAITVRSASRNPETCIIDCQGSGRGFYFHRSEAGGSVVEGFTIKGGYIDAGSPVPDYGGGVYCYYSSPTLSGCTISGNAANAGGGVYCDHSGLVLTGCTIIGNTTGGSGGGVYGGNSGLTLADCTIDGNMADSGSGGGVYFTQSSPMLSRCTIRGNRAGTGGGVYCVSQSAAVLTACQITSNTSTAGSGGGVYCYQSAPILTNCAISRNTTSGTTTASGGGVYCYACSPTLTNCTISRNRSLYGGFCCSSSSSHPVLTNCIVWGDSPQEMYVPSGTPVVSYCDVRGGYTGTGNIDLDPRFAFDDDFHLMADSPCIDTGINTPTGGLPATDAEGITRPLDGNGDGQAVADMGAHEFSAMAPAIALDATRIEFFTQEGQGEPALEALSIRNASGGTLNWTLSGGASWLQTTPAQGVSTGEVDPVTLTVNPAGLAHGSYSMTLQAADPAAGNSPRIVEVVLNVSTALPVPGSYPTIQAAIDAATVPGDRVVAADGVYSGPGNKNLDFHGKTVVLRSVSGSPASCVIDCQGDGRGLYFHCGEPAEAAVVGITIQNGYVTSSSPGTDRGGGVYCMSSSPTLTDCVISGNTALGSSEPFGGGVYFRGGDPALVNCTISGNTVSGPSACGGGVYSFTYNPMLFNCTVTGNNASGGSATGGGVYCEYGGATLTGCFIDGNTASRSGGGVCCYQGGPTLSRCTISANAASGEIAFGGGISCSSSSPTLVNCTITANTASSSGGGVYCFLADATLTNCEITGNRASDDSAPGGGVYCFDSDPTLTNCTITANTAAFAGGGVYAASSSPTLTGCVLWGDAPEEIYVASGAPVVTYCDVQGGHAGNGNLDADPLFADPNGPDGDPDTWQDNDYRLSTGSPCIDRGKNAAVPADTLDLDGDGDTTEPIPFDLDGRPRLVDDPATPDTGMGTPPIVDLGCYEYQPPPPVLGDLNCDGVIDLDDVAPFVLALVDPAAYEAAYPDCDPNRADMDAGGTVDGLDVQAFVNVLLGQ